MRKLASIITAFLLVTVLFFAQWVGATFGGLSSDNAIVETAIGLVITFLAFMLLFALGAYLYLTVVSLFGMVLWLLERIARILGEVKSRLHPEVKR